MRIWDFPILIWEIRKLSFRRGWRSLGRNVGALYLFFNSLNRIIKMGGGEIDSSYRS